MWHVAFYTMLVFVAMDPSYLSTLMFLPQKLMIISTEAEKTLNQSKMTISPWKTELVINKTCLRNATNAKYMRSKLTH